MKNLGMGNSESQELAKYMYMALCQIQINVDGISLDLLEIIKNEAD